jgi:hypothetical protein
MCRLTGGGREGIQDGGKQLLEAFQHVVLPDRVAASYFSRTSGHGEEQPREKRRLSMAENGVDAPAGRRAE